MSKHTPGPWGFIELDIGEYSYAYYITCKTGALGYLPRTEKHGDEIMRFQEADARLISAAPELLEALEIAVDADGGTNYDGEDDEVGERSCCGEVSYKPHRHDCWVVKARAAIAKAKGEQ